MSGADMARLLTITLAALLAISTLSACGRRGPLEAPSATANPSAAEKAPPVEDKPFILDGLIK
jgi:predicted small lipoprotein YifL